MITSKDIDSLNSFNPNNINENIKLFCESTEEQQLDILKNLNTACQVVLLTNLYSFHMMTQQQYESLMNKLFPRQPDTANTI